MANMEKVYLITIPSKEQGAAPLMFVTDDVNKVTGKYDYFLIQQVEFL